MQKWFGSSCERDIFALLSVHGFALIKEVYLHFVKNAFLIFKFRSVGLSDMILSLKEMFTNECETSVFIFLTYHIHWLV